MAETIKDIMLLLLLHISIIVVAKGIIEPVGNSDK